MGRVIKGSAESEERYTLAVPAAVIPTRARVANSFANARDPFADAGDPFAPTGDPFAANADSFAATAAPFSDTPNDVPVDPPVDLEAIYAQAQELVDEATRSAQSLVDEAQTRSHALLEDAANRADVLADAARREGHDEGYARGVLDARAQMAGMIDTMRELVDATRTERHALLASAEPELVRLAVGIAERVLHQQIALDRGVVVEMARAAIARIVDREQITVRVNPADIERMREHREELLALGDARTMRVVEDQRVDRGGVVIETDAGSIDAKISTQLNEVRKILHIVDDVVVQPAPSRAAPDSDEPPLAAVRAS